MKQEAEKKLEEFGNSIVQQINKGKNPTMRFNLRSLTNIIYDKHTKKLRLGEKTQERSFFNVGHAKKFLQTLEVAKVSKNLLDANKHASLRDVFYMVKRTIQGSNANVVDEQVESLSPDEPILVRINGTMKFMTGEELLNHARKNGQKIFDNGAKERYTNIGLKVCAFDYNYKIKEIPATLFIKHPSNKIKKITTASGRSVKVTLSHSLFISDNGLPTSAEVKDLKVGDWVAVPKRIKVETQTRNIDLVKNLISNCPDEILSLMTLKGQNSTICKILDSIDRKGLSNFAKINYKSNLSNVLGNWKRSAIPFRIVKDLNLDLKNYYNDLKITCKGAKHYYNCTIKCNPSLGEVMGFLLSEGGHSISKRRGERIISISNKRREFLESFEKSFLNCFGEKPAGKISYMKDDTYRLNVGYNLFSFILEYCLGYKVSRAWNKFLPPFLFDADEETISNFIRWYRLGDGSVINSKAKLIRFHTTSLSLVNGIIFLLLRLGILARVYKRIPKNQNHHLSYEIRVGNREDVIKLAKITGDFNNLNINKSVNFSSDKLVGIGKLIKNNLDKIKLEEEVYKKFNWYGMGKQETICRTTLLNSTLLLSKYGEIDNILKIISNYDIAWDKIVSIEDAGIAPYTVDIAVPVTQNFIGGNGLFILHNSDKAIEDLELITHLYREKLHINANKMGSVAGNVVIEDAGDVINWAKLGSGGWSIPSNVEGIGFKSVKSKYILYMEKQAVWERLHEDKFWDKHNCIIVTSQGQTTRGIRRLLERLTSEHKLPIYVLADFDPWGFYIYSVLKFGSISLAHMADSLAIPEAKFLGITADDISAYELKRHFIKFKEVDESRLKQIAEYDWFKNSKHWQRQFKMMKDFGAKVEIQALSSKGITFISDKYLPEKIKKVEFLD